MNGLSSTHGENREHENDVAEEFANGGPKDDTPHVGAEDAQRDGDSSAKNRQEGKSCNP